MQVTVPLGMAIPLSVFVGGDGGDDFLGVLVALVGLAGAGRVLDDDLHAHHRTRRGRIHLRPHAHRVSSLHADRTDILFVRRVRSTAV